MDCIKKSFITKKDAVNRITEIKNEEGDNRKPIRSYKCDKCGNYHLTSWSKNAKKKIENIKVNNDIRRIEDLAEYWKRKKGW